MPLYAYRCTKCGNRYEKIQSFSSVQDTVCPKCGGVVERPLTAPGLQFKGAGWYVNDYASKSSGSSSSDDVPSEAAAASESKSSESKASETKSSDTKPASSESKSTSTESSTKHSSTASTS